MHKFNVGDRIVANRHLVTSSAESIIPKGSKGTILELSSIPYIRWDVGQLGMHDAGGLCEYGHSTAEDADNLDLLTNDSDIKIDANPNEDRMEKLISLIAILRDKFPWKDVDIAEIIHSPEFALEAMIRECDEIRSEK